jgi:hypothetical protein
MALPTEAEVYTQFMEHLRKAQECSATISHLTGLNSSKTATTRGWLIVSEQLKRMQQVITEIAMGKLQ